MNRPASGQGAQYLGALRLVTTAEGLGAAVRDHAGRRLVPSAAVVVAAIPTTDHGKPDRPALSAILWPGQDHR